MLHNEQENIGSVQANLLGFGLGCGRTLLPQHSYGIPVTFCHLPELRSTFIIGSFLKKTKKFCSMSSNLTFKRRYLTERSFPKYHPHTSAKALFITWWRTVTCRDGSAPFWSLAVTYIHTLKFSQSLQKTWLQHWTNITSAGGKQ